MKFTSKQNNFKIPKLKWFLSITFIKKKFIIISRNVLTLIIYSLKNTVAIKLISLQKKKNKNTSTWTWQFLLLLLLLLLKEKCTWFNFNHCLIIIEYVTFSAITCINRIRERNWWNWSQAGKQKKIIWQENKVKKCASIKKKMLKMRNISRV